VTNAVLLSVERRVHRALLEGDESPRTMIAALMFSVARIADVVDDNAATADYITQCAELIRAGMAMEVKP